MPRALSTDESDWDRLAKLDRSVTRTDRGRLLFSLFREQPGSVRCVWNGSQPAGYFASRPGFLAVQLGPCCADAAAGELLMHDAWRRHANQRVIMDVPAVNGPAMRSAEAIGLQVRRAFTRMCRGAWVNDQEEFLWASAGPEKG